MNKLFLIFCLIFVACSFGYAQGEGGIIFPNGIVVAHLTEISVVTDKVEISDGKAVNIKLSEYQGGYFTSSENNKVHRILTFEKKKEYSGYTLEFLSNREKEKFVVKIQPLAIKPSKKDIPDIENWSFRPMPKYTDWVVVNDGDTISIEVLENPSTAEKVTDLIKITRKKRELGSYFSEKNTSKTPKDLTIEDIELRIMKYQIFVNDEKITESSAGVMGSVVWFNFPNGKNRGRLIFSLVPRAGYAFQKIGTISSEKIEFTFNGDKYRLTTDVPILLSSETWNLWVMFDPNYKSNAFSRGAADKVEYLFPKKQ